MDAGLHRLRTEISSRAWRQAQLMPQAEIAETTYTPKGWDHEPLRVIVRQVRIPVEELRRPTQPTPADGARRATRAGAEGRVEYVYGYSFILTDLEGDAAEIEL